MNQLRVGVIGVGHLGRHHARIYSSLSDADLVAIVDIDQARGRAIAEEFAVPFYQHFQHMLSKVDAVSVAVPTSQHFAVVRTCLEAGVHVLVEKPITTNVPDGERLVSLAKDQGCILQVGHVERFNPIMELVRPLIHEPGFLECHRLSPFQPRGTDVDVVLDLMIHDLDMVLSYDLGAVVSVEASGLAVLTEQIDIANARIRFEKGAVATFTASRISTGRLRKCRIFQSRAYLSINYQERQATIHRRNGRTGEKACVETEQFSGSEDEPLQRELLAFLNTVRHQSTPLVSGEDGVASLGLAHQIVTKIHLSTPVV
ncbi:MAG: Gfo/Idh/MocA family oxidoreductase [Nitrospirales bacterium]|nr:Gfo/Idh/MocA family oxidoreductase [Nitrospira sp.]MDR4502390.1 Gfo/Idh/MocA family oxidoreductase [Nitrospirales bacterium]